ncbi:PH domain-containing protein [Microbacterium halophytorum]|uniref:PH domain-containing protein n=1 Tax=Microbacterium halophytorum TaxID=2067568 RepID=UPI000CFB6CF2|nr:PH domain-containing protein [Microbacterium halophytorum]
MPASSGAPERVVFRSVAGLVWMWVAAGVCVLLLGDLLIRGSLEQAGMVTPWLLALVWFVYAFLYAPRIVASPDGVEVHNVLRTTTLSWGAIESITARWQIEFRMVPAVGGKPLQAWGAPTQHRRRSTKRDHPSESQLERLRTMLEEAPRGEASRSARWDVLGVASGIVIAFWLVVAIGFAL